MREVVSLGDELRAEENLRIAQCKAAKYAFLLTGRSQCITIHTDRSEHGKTFKQFLFDPLRSRTDQLQFLRLAFRTLRRHMLYISAQVAS